MTATTLIEIPAWGNANIVEIIWLLSGLVALMVTVAHIPDLLRDWRRATSQPGTQVEKRSFRLIAWGYLRREVVRALQGACITVIGGWAVTQPAFGGKDFTTPTGLILTAALFVQSALVSAQSFWDWSDRSDLDRLLRKPAHPPVAKEQP